jgi:glycine dehydrogenase
MIKNAFFDLFKETQFVQRHVGPDETETKQMLSAVDCKSLDELCDRAVPTSIRFNDKLNLPSAISEFDALKEIESIARKNVLCRSYIGLGYYGTVVPSVIKRNILENPGWYTQYTPYQAEISQGRLEALLNFQTAICDLTGLDVANASLLDEGTAVAESMHMALSSRDGERTKFFASNKCFPQTLSVLATRCEPLGVDLVVGDESMLLASPSQFFGAVFQSPDTDGIIKDFSAVFSKLRDAKVMAVIAADPLSLAIAKSPGEMGADVAVGSMQRLGVPMGFGGPHAAYFATRDEHKRKIPGRIIGVSKDSGGKSALRLALQTREQHIRREKATSNICTSQVLLAVMSSMYLVYHGPDNIKKIANRIGAIANDARDRIKKAGLKVIDGEIFDTVVVAVDHEKRTQILEKAASLKINFNAFLPDRLSFSIDETIGEKDYAEILHCFGLAPDITKISSEWKLSPSVKRAGPILRHDVFHQHHSETKMLRYIRGLESKDLSLTRSMIPLGSCTMKLNAASELYPISFPEFANIHPFAPSEQTLGYKKLFTDLESWLSEITGFSGFSLQPNSGAQGEFAGLLVIREFHKSKGQLHRNLCLIPKSAHGTNPASAAMCGFEVVAIDCDSHGNIDVADLNKKLAEVGDKVAALMVTYPSTHGVFEDSIKDICSAVKKSGGLVYMDGANMNAQVGICRPADFGADVCHLNLHKTFCIPHGGGGPGVGPIGVVEKLKPFLPGHNVVPQLSRSVLGPVTSAPWGSASILPISWMYIRMMGPDGLKKATQLAILNANYIAARLGNAYPILYKGKTGLVAHECIIDLRQIRQAASVEVEDVAKRLIDYGFHAPTMSWPVPHTLMIEPTESESKAEIDRFCEALLSIRSEIAEVEKSGRFTNNVLKNAPHTAEVVTSNDWDRSYSRQQAAFPASWVQENKFWPAVGRVDNAFGDRNLVCTCPSVEDFVASTKA